MKHAPGNTIVASDCIWRLPIALCCVLITSSGSAQDLPPVPVPMTATASYAEAVEAHMGYVTEHALDEYGPIHTPLWLATIDIHTSRLPEANVDERGDGRHDPLATSSLYLDQPTVVAAYELARRTGCKCYSDAANAYILAFLNISQRNSSHAFAIRQRDHYHVIRDEPSSLPGQSLRRAFHTPAWESLWGQSPDTTDRLIRGMAIEWMGAKQTQASAGTLAQQAIVLDSVCWLTSKTNEPNPELLQLARQITNDGATAGASTGEIGTWIETLIRASRYTGEPAFQQRASHLLDEWLEQHRDSMSGRRDLETIGVDDGSQPESTPSPNTKAPSPVTLESLPLAEACLSMWQVTNQENYRLAVTRWAQAIQTSLSEQAGHGSRSEEYGRAIHFLARASDAFQQPQWRKVAEQIADDAMSALYEPRLGMFRSRTGSDRCDAMDGPGFLLLALLYLDGPDPTAESALHF